MHVRDAMHRQVITGIAHETLPEAAVKMQLLKISRLPVLHEGQLVGIVTDGEIRGALPALSEHLSPWAFTVRVGRLQVRDVMRRPALSTHENDDLLSAVRLMLERRVGGLPVLDEQERLVGMLTNTDVLRAVLSWPPDTLGAVREHMSAHPVTLTPDEPLGDAAARLRTSRLRVAPVTLEGQLAGVLHDRDVRALVERARATHGPSVLGEHALLRGQQVRDVMREPGAEVLASVPLHSAVEAMLRADVHGLPVLSDGGTLLGVITVSDVFRAALGRQAPAP